MDAQHEHIWNYQKAGPGDTGLKTVLRDILGKRWLRGNIFTDKTLKVKGMR